MEARPSFCLIVFSSCFCAGPAGPRRWEATWGVCWTLVLLAVLPPQRRAASARRGHVWSRRALRFGASYGVHAHCESWHNRAECAKPSRAPGHHGLHTSGHALVDSQFKCASRAPGVAVCCPSCTSRQAPRCRADFGWQSAAELARTGLQPGGTLRRCARRQTPHHPAGHPRPARRCASGRPATRRAATWRGASGTAASCAPAARLPNALLHGRQPASRCRGSAPPACRCSDNPPPPAAARLPRPLNPLQAAGERDVP